MAVEVKAAVEVKQEKGCTRDMGRDKERDSALEMTDATGAEEKGTGQRIAHYRKGLGGE